MCILYFIVSIIVHIVKTKVYHMIAVLPNPINKNIKINIIIIKPPHVEDKFFCDLIINRINQFINYIKIILYLFF